MTKLMEISGKVALITGGANGIGLAMTDGLLSAGLKKAYIGDISDKAGDVAVQEMNKKHGQGKCEFIRLDVTSQEQYEDAFKQIISSEGSLDILLNNAGIINEKSWELMIDINFKSVMRGCLLALKYMPEQKNKGGCVVNTASTGSLEVIHPYFAGYVGTKHAVAGLTKSLGDHIVFEETGVRFVAIAPGATDTGILDDLKHHHYNPKWGEHLVHTLPLQYSYQSTEVVGRGVVQLIENAATGSIWVVDDSKLFNVTVPSRESIQTKIMDL